MGLLFRGGLGEVNEEANWRGLSRGVWCLCKDNRKVRLKLSVIYSVNWWQDTFVKAIIPRDIERETEARRERQAHM